MTQRIVSVAVRGDIAKTPLRNPVRQEWLGLIVEAIIDADWGNIDAVLLPAGFFKLDVELGRIRPADRAARLGRSEIAKSCRHAATRLAERSGAMLIVGVDTTRCRLGFSGDQMVVAWGPEGVVGSARKVFTSDGDTNEEGRPPYLLYRHDTDATCRLLTLPSGAVAALAVCYDAFAFAEDRIGPTSKRNALRFVADRRWDWRWTTRDERDGFVDRLVTGVRDASPDLLLIGVHGFKRPGREVYWQRHGIATASAALGGVGAVGAAHFAQTLPTGPQQAVLAAHGVPNRHLNEGLRRTAHRHPASSSAVVSAGRGRAPIAVLHLTEFGVRR